MLVRDYAMPVTGLPVQVVPTRVWFARLERVALGNAALRFCANSPKRAAEIRASDFRRTKFPLRANKLELSTAVFCWSCACSFISQGIPKKESCRRAAGLSGGKQPALGCIPSPQGRDR
jgi:hypothetical protein